jgi:hypothetical protein
VSDYHKPLSLLGFAPLVMSSWDLITQGVRHVRTASSHPADNHYRQPVHWLCPIIDP